MDFASQSTRRSRTPSPLEPTGHVAVPKNRRGPDLEPCGARLSWDPSSWGHPASDIAVAARPRAPKSRRILPKESADRPPPRAADRSPPSWFVHLGGSGSASVWDVLQSRRTGFTPFRIRVSQSPASARHRPSLVDRRPPRCACSLRRIPRLHSGPPSLGSLPSRRFGHRIEPGSRLRTLRELPMPTALRALFRGDDRARDRRCRRLPRALSFHGLLVPLRDQRSLRSQTGPIAELRARIAAGGCGMSAARRGTPASSRSWGWASSPGSHRAPALRWIPPFVTR